MTATLARPCVSLEPSYQAFLDELRANDEVVWPGRVRAEDEAADAFVARLLARAQATADPERPAESVWWGVETGADGADVVVGVIVLRHQLTERLRTYGGHVSYEVRPSWRRRGVATAMLAALLASPEALKIGRLIATTAEANTASRRTIERHGGTCLETVFVHEVQRRTCIYELRAQPGSP